MLSCTSLGCLFLAVAGPVRGLLFLLRGVCSSSSCSSSNVVGRVAAALRLSVVHRRLSGGALVYNCVGWSSSSCSGTGLSEGRFLLCWPRRFPLGVSAGCGGFAKLGRVERRLLGVLEAPEVPALAWSSSWVSRRRRLFCSLWFAGLSVPHYKGTCPISCLYCAGRSFVSVRSSQ